MNWISIKDRLPEVGVTVILYCYPYRVKTIPLMTIGTLMPNLDEWNTCAFTTTKPIDDVKYWMPLPEPSGVEE